MQRNVEYPAVNINTPTHIKCTHILCRITAKRPVTGKASSTDGLQGPQSIVAAVTDTPYHRIFSVPSTHAEQSQLSSTTFPKSPFQFYSCTLNFSPEISIFFLCLSTDADFIEEKTFVYLILQIVKLKK